MGQHNLSSDNINMGTNLHILYKYLIIVPI